MIEKLRFLASGHGIALVVISILTLGTVFLLFHRISDMVWLELIKWIVGIWISGAAAAAYRPK